MSQTTTLLQALKLYLKRKGITYKLLGQQLDLSESSIKRLFKDESFTLHRLEQLLNTINLTYHDLTRLTQHASDKQNQLTEEQELFLSTDRIALTVFYLLVKGWKAADIQQTFHINKPNMDRTLLKMDKLNLLELHSNNRIKMLVAETFQWRPSGPVEQLFLEPALQEFMAHPFDNNQDGYLRFLTSEVSPETIKLLHRKLNVFQQELKDLLSIDQTTPLQDRQSIGLLLAFRPWTLSFFQQLRDKTASTS